MDRLRVAVVGVGHLGKAHARILSEFPDVELVGVVDTDFKQAVAVAQRCDTTAYSSHEPLFNIVDAVSVVVPTTHHLRVARDFLTRGIPVLVEKPITSTLAQADELVDLADEKDVLLQVGHIERFNPAFEELQRRPIQPKFVECERHGPYTGRSTDIGAVLDLMIHDLDILLTLVGGLVVDVEAVGASVFGGHEDVVNARLKFANGCVAHVTSSRVSPRPKRMLRVYAPEGYAGADLLHRRLRLVQPSEHLRRHGLRPERLDPVNRANLAEDVFRDYLEVVDLDCSKVEHDQLTAELLDFTESVRTGRRPRVTGGDGRAALAVAERILSCIQVHPWTADPDGPMGPNQLPSPLTRLFDPPQDQDSREAA